MVGYKVALDWAHSPFLQRYYTLDWSVMGNLGVELLVIPLAKLIGLEPAVKLILLCVPPLTAAGFLWVAREAHGRIPPTALFAAPLTYSYPFHFGFANFVLSMALAFPAFGLWLRLGRLGRLRLRAMLFVPISAAVWLAHAFGWAVLGVLAFSAELVRQRDCGRQPLDAALHAILHCLVLAGPAILTLAWWSGGVDGGTESWFAVVPKLKYFLYALRDRWVWADVPSVLIVLGLIAVAVRSRAFGFSRSLATAGLICLAVYLLLPQRIFGSAYADMRLLPYTLAIGLLAIRPKRDMPWLPAFALVFVVARIGTETASLDRYGRAFDRELAALDHLPRGARLVSFVGTPCRDVWQWPRLDHLPGMATVRREAFANDQWSMPGGQINFAHYPAAGDFELVPSQSVRVSDCGAKLWRTLDQSLRAFPRTAFDYVWLIDPPPYDPRLTAGMVPVWTNGRSVLFRIVDRNVPVTAGRPGFPRQ
jgi:hypothetical protein